MRAVLIAALWMMGSPALAGEVGEKAIQPADLPAAVRHAVDEQFPRAKITAASEEDGRYEASLLVHGEKRDVTLDAHGKVLEIERSLATADLPRPVFDMLKLRYAQWRIARAEQSDRPGHESVFEVLMQRGSHGVEVALSRSGVVLKTETQDDDED